MQRESVNQKRGVSARNRLVWLAVLIAAPATLPVSYTHLTLPTIA